MGLAEGVIAIVQDLRETNMPFPFWQVSDLVGPDGECDDISFAVPLAHGHPFFQSFHLACQGRDVAHHLHVYCLSPCLPSSVRKSSTYLNAQVGMDPWLLQK